MSATARVPMWLPTMSAVTLPISAPWMLAVALSDVGSHDVGGGREAAEELSALEGLDERPSAALGSSDRAVALAEESEQGHGNPPGDGLTAVGAAGDPRPCL